MTKKLTHEELIDRFTSVHGTTYDYSKVTYINAKTKIIIICLIHGEFSQNPFNHLNGGGCNKCFNERTSKRCKKTTAQFIKEAKEIHGDLYDYSLTNYSGAHNKLIIICPLHGIFEKIASEHLNGGGCQKCLYKKYKDKYSKTTAQFIKEAKEIHGDLYDYSLTNYSGAHNKLIIICPLHGIFEQFPGNHLNGGKCQKCNKKIKTSPHLLDFYKNHPIGKIKGQQLGHYYQIRLFNETESFYKRGVTSLSIKSRFGNKISNYNYEIIDDKIMTNLETTEQEEFDKIKYKHLSYEPQDTSWGGYKECYNERIIV